MDGRPAGAVNVRLAGAMSGRAGPAGRQVPARMPGSARLVVPSPGVAVPRPGLTVPRARMAVPGHRLAVPGSRLTAPLPRLTVPVDRVAVRLAGVAGAVAGWLAGRGPGASARATVRRRSRAHPGRWRREGNVGHLLQRRGQDTRIGGGTADG